MVVGGARGRGGLRRTTDHWDHCWAVEGDVCRAPHRDKHLLRGGHRGHCLNKSILSLPIVLNVSPQLPAVGYRPIGPSKMKPQLISVHIWEQMCRK